MFAKSKNPVYKGAMFGWYIVVGLKFTDMGRYWSKFLLVTKEEDLHYIQGVKNAIKHNQANT